MVEDFSGTVKQAEREDILAPKRVHFKLSLAGGDTSQGKQPWSVSPPTTASKQKRQFEMHPCILP
jgi:hypothetical protein